MAGRTFAASCTLPAYPRSDSPAGGASLWLVWPGTSLQRILQMNSIRGKEKGEREKKRGKGGRREGERRGQVASQAILPAAELLCVALPSHT